MHQKLLSKLFFLSIGMLVGAVLILPRLDTRADSLSSITHTSQNDFAGGTVSGTLDINVTPGEVRLKQDKYTEESNLEEGSSSENDSIIAEGSVSLGLDYIKRLYNEDSTPALGSNWPVHSFLDDTVTGYLYVSTPAGGGLDVIDTEANTLITRYHTGSTPALANNDVYHSFRDPLTGYLYVSTNGGGLSVIDTETNTLITRYHTGSTPALASNQVYHAFRDSLTGYLYVSTAGGLSVIDTDTNTLVIRYHTGSTPALANNSVSNAFLDPDTGYVYISTSAGLSVIDTDTNTLVIHYHTDSTPALLNNRVNFSFRDPLTGFLYIGGGNGGGLSVIDTETNTLITRYYPGFGIRYAFRDPLTGFLYVSVDNADVLSVINTETDTLVIRYNPNTVLGFPFSYGTYEVFRDTATGYLYIGLDGAGLIVIDEYPGYFTQGQHLSQPISLTQQWQNISWEETLGDHGELTLQYRTGDDELLWVNEFENADSYAGDYYEWESSLFQDISIEDGVITLSNPDEDWGGYTWFDTGEPTNSFPAGSVIRARVRLQTQSEDYYEYCLFTDEWEGGSGCGEVTNEWVTLTLNVEEEPFSLIGLQIYEDEDDWEPTDSFQIDWITISSPIPWSEWSEPCSNQYGCAIDPADLEDKEWIQYRLNLSTTDTSQTPVVNSVTFASGYQDSGEFVSSVVNAGEVVDWDTLTADTTTPTGTSISFFTRSGNTATPDGTWSEWSPVNSPINSPDSQYLQYKTILSTTDENVTPALSSVTLGYTTLGTTPTPTPVPGTVTPPAFVKLSKIGNVAVTDGVYTYYYANGKNLTFSGTTSPNAQVILTIESDPITCETEADAEGEWICTFDQEVPNGYHTLTVSAYYPGSSVISTEKYTLGIGVGLADTGDPAVVSLLAGSVLLLGGTVMWYRRKKPLFVSCYNEQHGRFHYRKYTF